MDVLVIVILGLCFAYQGRTFYRSRMHGLLIAYSASVAAMLVGYIYRWPDALRLACLVAAVALLLVGALRVRKSNQG